METIIPTVKSYLLETVLPGEDPEALSASTELVRSGILDSLATLELVSFLEKQFDIELEAHDVGPGNLGTLEDIARLVRSKLALSA